MLIPNLSKAARKFIKSRSPKHGKQIATKIYDLCNNPAPTDSEALRNSPERFRRADIGEYRIIYRVEAETLEVFAVGKRNDGDVYRRLARK